MKMRWTALIPLLVFLALVAALAFGLRQGEQTKFARHVGEAVPVTSLPGSGKNPGFSTQEWMGRPYLINFFASWCAPCQAEHETLMRLAKQEHLPIVGVAFEDRPEEIAALLAKHGNPYAAIGDDKTGHAAIDWGVTGVPETFLIDARGIIRLHVSEPLTDAVIERQLLPLWKEMEK